jgi:hypothetical protein
MKIQTFLEHFCLHDSGIDNCQYFPIEQQLILTLELPEPENTIGYLYFFGVKNLISDPNINQIQWGEQCNGVILNIAVSASPDSLNEQIEILLEVVDYPKKIKTVFVLNFLAFDIKWIPLK